MIFFISKNGDGLILTVVGGKYHSEFTEAEENSAETFAKRSPLRDKQWTGLSESNRHLNLGKSAEDGLSRTYKAFSVAIP
jgi:hypothetical protein